MLRYPSIISPSSLNMKTTRFALALLALATCPAFAEYPETLFDGASQKVVVYDNSTNVDFTIDNMSTKIVGNDENGNTLVKITGITRDEDVFKQEGMAELVFVRGQFENNGTITASQINLMTSTSYTKQEQTGTTEDGWPIWGPAETFEISGSTSFTNNGTIDLSWTEYDDFWKTEENRTGYFYVSTDTTFINKGTVTADLNIRGGNLEAEGGSIFNHSVEVGFGSKGGSLQVNGAITMNGDLVGTSGDIIIMEGGSIDMKGNDVTLTGVNLVYMVEGNVSELTPINTSDLFINADIDDSTSITVKGTDGGSYTTTMGQLVVPEPTTATLSLLALCGLAMRRRRAAH